MVRVVVLWYHGGDCIIDLRCRIVPHEQISQPVRSHRVCVLVGGIRVVVGLAVVVYSDSQPTYSSGAFKKNPFIHPFLIRSSLPFVD